MATCEFCGAQVPDGLNFCTSCGAAQQTAQQAAPAADIQQSYQPPAYGQAEQPGQQPYGQQPYGQQPGQQYGQAQPVYAAPAPAVNDSGSIGWGILGFFIPIVGLVLFLVWKNTKPKCAKVAGIGALIGVCLSLAVNFFYLPTIS